MARKILMASKQLVVNADDFGFTPDVNSGIVEAHRQGILTATTLMATGDAFEDAVRLARETPSLDIGCHLVLIGNRSLITGAPFPATPGRLAAALALGRIRVYDELSAQIRKILQAGIHPTHLDTHKHTHLAPPVLDAVARLGEDFDIRWIRRPFDFPLSGLRAAVPRGKQVTSDAIGLLRRRFRRVLGQHGCRSTDHFAGFQITGRFGAARLEQLLALMPEGSTELMVHPGHHGPALDAAPTRLKQSRESELHALCDPGVRAALERHRIDLVNYPAME
ncbi:MAG: ChbG/HpnK family deacetylase [Candidatus Solibacter sp.]